MISWGRVRRWGVIAALLAVQALLPGCRHAEQTRTLTFAELFAADSSPETRGQKVLVTGVVVYSDPEWRLLILQDPTHGVYITPPPNNQFHAGDELEVTGITTVPEKLLEKTEFRVVSTGKLPRPLELPGAAQFSDHPIVFARVPAVVRWTGVQNGRATIEAYAGNATVKALIYPGTSEDLPRVGSEIRIAGVTGVDRDNHGQFRAWRFLTPSSKSVEVLQPGPQNPFSLPLSRFSELRGLPAGKLVHISGKAQYRGSSLLISDAVRSVAVDARDPLHGDFQSAEVVGFWNGTSIEDAMLRPAGELQVHKGDIRTISELKHLSVAEASARRSVSIRGVVTYADPNWGLMFVQDRSGAVFVNTTGLNLQMKPGDLVDVAGEAGPGDYAPVIQSPEVSFIGSDTLPQPFALDPVQSNLSMSDSRWCRFHGVVRSVQVVDGHTNLKLGAGEAAVNVQIPSLIDGERFRDKDILVTGALGILFNERRQAVGHQIFVPSPEFVSLVDGGGKPNPESTIAMLRRYSPEFDEHHSVGLHGQVVLNSAAGTIFVEDESAGIQVRSMAPLSLNLGDHVSVRGFLRPGGYSPAIEDAVVIRERSGSLPEPQHVTATNITEGFHDSQYVSMTGQLASIRQAPNSLTLTMNDNGNYFDVTGPPSSQLASLRLGSQIEARGVFQVVLDRSHVPYTVSGFTLAFDSPNSIVVRQVGPWWDARKVRGAGLLFAIFAAFAALWAILLRREVRTRTRELQSSLGAQKRAQAFDRARNEVLETIARNAPLPESMECLTLALQDQLSDTICMVLMPPDGKSFVDGKPSPLLIAPGIPEDVQHSHAMIAVLQHAVKADDSHFLAADEDLVERIKAALKTAGLTFASGYSSLVFSASGSVSGMLVLLSRQHTSLAEYQSLQSMLQSASRLISLAREHWQMHERLLHEARHDGLTGLPNRAVAEDRLEQALARAARRKKSFAVFCIDLDGFKRVNDELGHDAGDELLRTAAQRFRGRIRHSDTLARMGGDEFLALIDDCAGDAAARSVADLLIASLQDTVAVEGRDLCLSASIGIAMYPADGENASQLRRHADLAMYRAKSAGGGQACFLSRDPESTAKTAARSLS